MSLDSCRAVCSSSSSECIDAHSSSCVTAWTCKRPCSTVLSPASNMVSQSCAVPNPHVQATLIRPLPTSSPFPHIYAFSSCTLLSHSCSYRGGRAELDQRHRPPSCRRAMGFTSPRVRRHLARSSRLPEYPPFLCYSQSHSHTARDKHSRRLLRSSDCMASSTRMTTSMVTLAPLLSLLALEKHIPSVSHQRIERLPAVRSHVLVRERNTRIRDELQAAPFSSGC